MSLRRLALLVLPFGLWACKPSVPYSPPPAFVDYAMFDPAPPAPVIPLPNDLAYSDLALATQPAGAQRELLLSFRRAGGFPDDTEVPVTIELQQQNIDAASGALTRSAPTLDAASLKLCLPPTPAAGCNAVVLEVGARAAVDLEYAGYTTDPATSLGTLTLRKKAAANGTRYWATGKSYIVALRGGTSGVTVNGGSPLNATATTFVLTQAISLNVDLSNPENQAALPGTTPAEKLAAGQLLEGIRQSWSPGFAALQQKLGWAAPDVALAAVFTVSPQVHVELDKVVGVAPLPSDFLLDACSVALGAPRVASNPSFCGGVFDQQPSPVPVPGCDAPTVPSCPLSRGLASLDGFSTTAMLIAPTTGPIVVAQDVGGSTVSAFTGNVFLYDLGPAGTSAPALVAPADYDELLPAPLRQLILPGFYASELVGLQPAVPTKLTSKALKEGTEYAVVITDRVQSVDPASGVLSPLGRGTVGSLLLFDASLLANGHSTVPGLPDADAKGLEHMRLMLQPVFAALPSGTTKNDVAMAYTFRTETISGTYATLSHGGTANSVPGAIQISAIPYTALLPGVCAALGNTIGVPNLDCTKPLPAPQFTFNAYTATGGAGANVTDVFLKYGVDPAAVPHGNIDTIYEFQIATVNKLDNLTGAFDPSPTAQPEVLTVLLAVGAQPAMPACTGPLAPFAAAGLRCAPLGIFQHGITASKSYTLSVADALVAAGNVVAGIDLVWHGDRTYCNTSASPTNRNIECAGGSICVPDPALAGQAIPPGEAPGKCRAGAAFTDPPAPFLNQATVCPNPGTIGVPGSACALASGVHIMLDPATGLPSNEGYPVASGEFLVTANFFRTRDSLRQSLIDHTQLLQVVAPTPQPGPIAGNALYNALLAKGVLVSPLPGDTSFVGMSLGSMVGAVSVAANPRFSKAVLNAAGGTLVDVFTTAPSLQAQVDALFLSLGIDRSQLATNPAMAARYLQTLSVLKWILDPADPLNATGHLASNTWPNLVPPLGGKQDGSVAQAAKPALTQAGLCDQTVPNPFNALFAATAGLSPALPPAAPPGPAGTVQWFVNTSGPTFAPSPAYPSGCASGVGHAFYANWGTGITDPTRLGKEQALTTQAQSSTAAFLASPVPLTPTLVVR